MPLTPNNGAGSFNTRGVRPSTSRMAVSAVATSLGFATVTVTSICRITPKLCRISPTIFRFGTITSERSACSSLVVGRSMWNTSPSTPATLMYSPTRNGFVTMMVSPAMRLLSTPWKAKPTPTPATPMPATSGVICTPSLSSAATPAAAMITTRRTRTRRIRKGGSILPFCRRWSAAFPTQRAASTPTIMMITAPTMLRP